MAGGTLVPWPGIESLPPALEGGILTTGPPGKSLDEPWKHYVQISQTQKGHRVSDSIY